MKHRVKQQIQLTTAGPHDKVGAADGAGEGLADLRAQVLDADAADDAEEWLEKNAELQSTNDTAPNQEEFEEAIEEAPSRFKLPKFLGGE